MSDDIRPFPIQAGIRKRDKNGHLGLRPSACTIPWWLAEEVYRGYVAAHSEGCHIQSLERLAERGGFSREDVLWYLRYTKQSA